MGKSELSRSQIEKDGWTVVHEDEEGGQYRAERFLDSNTKIEAVGMTEGLLLESIAGYYAHMKSIEPAPATEPSGEGIKDVSAPDEEQFTDEEWSLRDSGYKPAAAAAAAREELARDAEDAAKADPRGELKMEQITEISPRDHQDSGTYLVQKGEKSLSEAVDRKLEQTAAAEAARGELSGSTGIGPHADDPMGGPAETFNPAGLPGATEQAMDEEDQAAIDKAMGERDDADASESKPKNGRRKRQPEDTA